MRAVLQKKVLQLLIGVNKTNLFRKDEEIFGKENESKQVEAQNLKIPGLDLINKLSREKKKVARKENYSNLSVEENGSLQRKLFRARLIFGLL